MNTGCDCNWDDEVSANGVDDHPVVKSVLNSQ
jgi:hypothetical protein